MWRADQCLEWNADRGRPTRRSGGGAPRPATKSLDDRWNRAIACNGLGEIREFAFELRELRLDDLTREPATRSALLQRAVAESSARS
jgi:hypothetical protein